MLEKILNSVRKLIFPLTFSVLSFLGISCEQYNRPAITSNGKFLVVSLNKEGKFETDSSSELYSFDIEKLKLERLTMDEKCDSWVDACPDGGEVLFVKGGKRRDGYGGEIYTLSREEPIKISGFRSQLCNFPIWIDGERIFYTELSTLDRDFEIVCNLLSLGHGPDAKASLEELVRIPFMSGSSPKKHLISTTPAFSENNMYYAVANRYEIDSPKDEKTKNEGKKFESMLNVTLYALDMKTKKQEEVTNFNFIGQSNDLDSMPVGWMDLALSPDEKQMICCFLPGGNLDTANFDDKNPSLVYLVNICKGPEGSIYGEKKILSNDVNMYYPQWAPVLDKRKTISTERKEEERKEKAGNGEEGKKKEEARITGSLSLPEKAGINQEKEIRVDLTPLNIHSGILIGSVVDSGLKIINANPNNALIYKDTILWTVSPENPDISFSVKADKPGEYNVKVKWGILGLDEIKGREDSLEGKLIVDEKFKEPKPQFLYLSGQDLKDGRSVWVSDLEGNRKELAKLPGKAMEAYTSWTWLDSEQLRIFHVCDSGIVLIDSNREGSKKEIKYLPNEDLFRLKSVADLESIDELFGKQTERMFEEYERGWLTEETRKLVEDSITKSLKPLKEIYVKAKEYVDVKGINYKEKYPLPEPYKPEEKSKPEAVVPEKPIPKQKD